MVFRPEEGSSEPESRCRVDWDVRCEKVRKKEGETVSKSLAFTYPPKPIFAWHENYRIAWCLISSVAWAQPLLPLLQIHAYLALKTFLFRWLQALNDQINVEYTASYAYHSLFAYFDRDTVALKGFAKFFNMQSEEVPKKRKISWYSIAWFSTTKMRAPTRHFTGLQKKC
jgi:hypothetical protein